MRGVCMSEPSLQPEHTLCALVVVFSLLVLAVYLQMGAALGSVIVACCPLSAGFGVAATLGWS